MTAIRAEAVSKAYVVRRERRRTLKGVLLRQYAGRHLLMIYTN